MSLQDRALWTSFIQRVARSWSPLGGQVIHSKSSPMPPVLREPEPNCRCDYLIRPPEGRSSREVKHSELFVITNKISLG